jgi:uncharacterized membrane protein YeaQ/YmgE (transglycosylase-associated protein family)
LQNKWQEIWKERFKERIIMDIKNETFNYNYSSKQQEEIQRIREKYVPKEENKMEQLRHLDESATKPGTIAALAVGIIGTLLLGVGMCCSLVWAESYFIVGIVIGVIGIAVLVAAYPLYMYITKKQREKIAPEILKLTEELSQE